MDAIDEAYDNATYLFEYAINEKDNINHYFVINKNSPDYVKLKKQYEDVVSFGSLKHKLLYLYSEKLILSNIKRKWNNPFDELNRKLFAGLNNAGKYYLQHLIKEDDDETSLKKFYSNLSFFLTDSDYEQDRIVNGHYNYNNDTVKCFRFSPP